MKNVELWTRDTDRKILVAACALAAVAFAAFIGGWLPPAGPAESFYRLNCLLSAALLLFVWGAFRIVRPARYSRKWMIAEFIVVPLAWALIIAVLAFWSHQIFADWLDQQSWRYDIML